MLLSIFAIIKNGTFSFIPFIFLIIGFGVIACLPASIARKKGYSYGGFWAFGFLFFFTALIVTFCLKDKKQQQYKQNKQDKILSDDGNRGTFYDTSSKALGYFTSRMTSSKRDPFILYKFTNEKDAREALLELPCIKVAKDTNKMICTEVLNVGCYFEEDEKVYHALLGGKELSHELWELAGETFKRHGGKLHNEQEPEKRDSSENKKPKPSGFVSFVKQDRVNDGLGTAVYRIYKASDAETAKEFLSKNPVTKQFYYIVVETPDGNYGRDINGIYKE